MKQKVNIIYRYVVRRVRRLKKKKLISTRYKKYKEESRILVHERILFWNQKYGFKYGRISIKDTKTRWGSCSKKGNLNFSYKILFLPAHLVDYVIVHELCHLKEFNHSQSFWNLVGQTIPDYENCKNELKTHGATYVR